MKYPGDDLFSQEVAPQVSSALESLTSVFGMGTGGASSLASPGYIFNCPTDSRVASIGPNRVWKRDFVVSPTVGPADPYAVQLRARRVN